MNSRNISKNEQTNDFDNLKSDYFLLKIFDIMKKINHLKLLNIIKNYKKD